jgi:hypothetical protein
MPHSTWLTGHVVALLLLLGLLARPVVSAASIDPGGGVSAPEQQRFVFIPALHDAKHVPVPHSFLGLSHEPLTMAKHALPTPQYQAFIRMLSSFETGPFIIRWGGNEQDKLLELLDDEQWISMRDLHASTGVKYMLGLNLRVSACTSASVQPRRAP